METTEELLEKIKNRETKVKEFEVVLEKIKDADNKTRLLWLEIYENAVTDRENAYILFHEAYSQMAKSAAEHIATGPILNKYLERMNKANDQMIKLAELISKAEEQSSKIDPEDIFSQIKES
tara:strand:- start:348 stop:713 length:366 start_codon:yes stop_codon:yes gene_type:complete